MVLLDSNDDFEVYRVHNLPTPFNSNDEVMSGSVASYRLEAGAIAHQLRASDPGGTRGLFEGFSWFLLNQKPSVPDQFKPFLHNGPLYEKHQNCQTTVKLDTVIPMAEYLTDGNWIITTQRKLVFSLVCQENEGETRELEVQPPLDVIMLPMTCSASNEYVTLMPYYEKESKFQVEDSISELLLNARVANTTIWKPFHEKLPDFSAIELPDRLQAVEQIPLKRLIAELSGQGELVEDTVGSHPAWSYAGVGTLVLVMVLIVVIYKCKGRCPGRSARWRGGGRNSGAAAEVPGMQMVSVTTTGDCAAARSRLRSTSSPEAEPRPLPFARLHGRWFQRFCAGAETEGTISFSLGRPGALQQRGGDGDGLPGTATFVAGTVRARCLVPAGTRWTTPRSSNSNDSFIVPVRCV